jgi:acyl CoA:acetate/3-ketoacid CoA transferase beta subunit
VASEIITGGEKNIPGAGGASDNLKQIRNVFVLVQIGHGLAQVNESFHLEVMDLVVWVLEQL